MKILDLILDASTAVNGRGRAARTLLYGWFAAGVLSFWMFFWWSIGMWPTEIFGAGFARTEQVQNLYVSNLETDLIDLRIRQCSATTNESRQFFLQRLQEKEREYYEITGHAYVRPSCNEVVTGE